MNKALLISTICAFVFTFAFSASAMADEYGRSINGCRDAIGKQMGISGMDVRYKLKKVKTRARARDIGFVVSARDSASPIQGVVVTCKVKRHGEVLALEFADEQYHNAVATH